MTDSTTVRFQHDKHGYTARYDRPAGGAPQWQICDDDPDDDDLVGAEVLRVVDGEFDQALSFLAIRAAQHEALARPHLEQQAIAEQQHALLTHLVGLLEKKGALPKKSKGRKIRA